MDRDLLLRRPDELPSLQPDPRVRRHFPDTPAPTGSDEEQDEEPAGPEDEEEEEGEGEESGDE